MKYFYTENGSIVKGPMDLPNAWKNISGFHNTDSAKLKALGWLPQIRVGNDLVAGVNEVKLGPVHIVDADAVTSTWTVRAMTQQEIDAAAAADEAADIQKHNNAEKKLFYLIWNKIRVLEGKAEITPKQFRTWWNSNVA